MDVRIYKEQTKETVVDPMIEFIEEWGAEGYTREDVSECERLMYRYLDALAALSEISDDAIMEQVKILVLALNELNEETDMIETVEREAIWEIVQASAVDCGLQNIPDDVTEEWREW